MLDRARVNARTESATVEKRGGAALRIDKTASRRRAMIVTGNLDVAWARAHTMDTARTRLLVRNVGVREGDGVMLVQKLIKMKINMMSDAWR
jgi:hypothetical protein